MAIKIALFGLLSISVLSASPIIEIKDVAGKTPKEVESVLGAPTQTEKVKQGVKSFYKNDSVEIVFIDGKADWITITPAKKTPFSKESLAELGLEVKAPTFANEHVLKWEPYDDYHSISIFPGTNGIDYIYVMAKTK